MCIESPSLHPARIGGPDPMELAHVAFAPGAPAPRLHATFAVGVVEHGAARVRYRGEVAIHRPGGIVVLEPGAVHVVQPIGDATCGVCLAYPTAAHLRRLARLPDAGDDDAPLFDAGWYPDAELADRFATAHALLERAPSACDGEAGERALGDVLATLVRRHGVRGPAADGGRGAEARRVVRRVTAHLHARLGQSVRLAELAEVAGMGPFALTRCFRRVVGVPPYAYLELLRVERAKELLRGGTAITEVAHVTGFSDQSHLTRHFRRVVGVPPGRYARAHAAGRARRAA